MEVIMPELGETVAEGVVTKWHKKVGDAVKADEMLFDVETDKVSTEIPAPVDGIPVDCGSWWFNLLPPNTEPLLRLNLEASTRDDCNQRVAEVLALITSV